MNHDDVLRLSAAGRDRRDAMRLELIASMRRLHQARRARRRAIVIGVPLLAAGVIVATFVHRASQSATPGSPTQTAGAPAVKESDSFASIRFIATDPEILDRCRVRTTSSQVDVIDDDALLGVLDQIDRPAGLIVVDGQVRLTVPVVDKRQGPPSSSLRSSDAASAG